MINKNGGKSIYTQIKMEEKDRLTKLAFEYYANNRVELSTKIVQIMVEYKISPICDKIQLDLYEILKTNRSTMEWGATHIKCMLFELIHIILYGTQSPLCDHNKGA